MADPDRLPLDDTRIAVVGGGIAGLTAARRLAKAGATVTVFERSRGCGGRLATRRLPMGSIDHGAQYVTAREPGFKAFVARAKALGTVVAWSPRGKDGQDEWLVGVPGMSDMVDALIDGFLVTFEKEVTAIAASDAGCDLLFRDGSEAAGFSRVVVAMPAPEAAALLAPHGAPFERIAEAVMAPCWTLIAAFAAPLDPGFDMLRNRGALTWAARSASKPGRAGEIWVAQASPAWTREQLDLSPEEAIPKLTELLAAAVGPLPDAVHLAGHLWRHALVEKAVGETFLLSPDGRLGACGDWMIAPRVEAAWASGEGLAEAIVATAHS